jgi:hypothetical protein
VSEVNVYIYRLAQRRGRLAQLRLQAVARLRRSPMHIRSLWSVLWVAPHLTVVSDVSDDVGADSIRVAPAHDWKSRLQRRLFTVLAFTTVKWGPTVLRTDCTNCVHCVDTTLRQGKVPQGQMHLRQRVRFKVSGQGGQGVT